MAIKVDKVTVIDDGRNIVNVKNFVPAVSSTRYGTASLELTLDTTVGSTGFSSQVKSNTAIIAVSAPNQTNDAGKQTGRVYLYTKSGTKYAEVINPSSTYGTFGASLALDDTSSFSLMMVGNQSTNNTSVYVYEYLYPGQGQPSLLRTITNPNTRASSAADKFGWCVGMANASSAGKRYVVGAPGELSSAGGVLDTGVIYVYDNNGALTYTLENPTGVNGVSFGSKFVCCGIYLIVAVENRGVYIYDLTNGNLVKTITNTFGYNTFANNVDAQFVASSNTYQSTKLFAVSARSTSTTGRVLIYSITRVSASEVNVELVHNLYSDVYTSDNGSFGEALSMNDQLILIGAPRAYSDQRGMAYIYDLTDGKYAMGFEDGYTTTATRFANSVYLNQSDNTVLIGIKNYGQESPPTEGRVKVYEASYAYNMKSIASLTYFDGTEIDKKVFTQDLINYPKFRNTNGITNSGYGWSTCLTEDCMIVGAPLQDYNSKTNLGMVYVYDRETNTLKYKIEPPAGVQVTTNTCFGHTVRTDGKLLAVGCGGNVTMGLAGTNGTISVYDLDTGTFLHTVAPGLSDFGKGMDIHPGGILVGTAPANNSNIYVYNSFTGALKTTISSYGGSIAGLNRVGLFGKDDNIFVYVQGTSQTNIVQNLNMAGGYAPSIHTIMGSGTYGFTNAFVGWGAEISEYTAFAVIDTYTAVMTVKLTNNQHYIALVDYYSDPYVQAYEKLPTGITGTGMTIVLNSKMKRSNFAADDVKARLHKTLLVTASSKDSVYLIESYYGIGGTKVDGVPVESGTTISFTGDFGGLNADTISIRDLALNGLDVIIGTVDPSTAPATNKLGQAILRPVIKHSAMDRVYSKYSRA